MLLIVSGIFKHRLLASLLASYFLASAASAAGSAKHVVLIVWDGMRPDFISEKTTPTLYQLSQQGVFFQNHHSVFVSSTEVNGVALATGAYPQASGIMANKEYRPEINLLKAVAIEDVKAIRKGDEVSHGRYLQVATVAEILRAQNPPQTTAVVGSKPVALLLDREARPDRSPSRVLAEGETLPPSAKEALVSALGPFPPVDHTKIDRDRWTTRALMDQIWSDNVPAFSVLWLAEPDFSQHETGPGSAVSLAAIKSSDDRLADVLQALTKRDLLSLTDLMIVSDHGFSTIERTADLATDLATGGLITARAFVGQPVPGTVLVVGNGGSANLYVVGHDRAVIERAVELLQKRDYTGVVFTRDGLPGTFPFSLAKINTTDAPDIVVSFRWSPVLSATGTPGLVVSETGGGRRAGQGMHASLSRYDLHNILIGAGPDFRKGVVDPLPSGNTDLAPTVLWLLGVKPSTPMDGRVLSEALTIDGPKLESFDTRRHEVSRDLGESIWRQYLTVSQVNGVYYFDEGNGGATAKP